MPEYRWILMMHISKTTWDLFKVANFKYTIANILQNSRKLELSCSSLVLTSTLICITFRKYCLNTFVQKAAFLWFWPTHCFSKSSPSLQLFPALPHFKMCWKLVWHNILKYRMSEGEKTFPNIFKFFLKPYWENKKTQKFFIQSRP